MFRFLFQGALILSFLITPLSTCTQSQDVSATDSTETLESPYAFEKPDRIFWLSKDLREISGLTVLDERYLGAIQDEKGRLFILDIETGEIVDEKKFGDSGDYEALARIDRRLYILESNGNLFEIEDWQAEDLEVDRHKTDLDARNDTEGLAYDVAHNRLLIVCKEYPGKNLKGHKAVYAFDLQENELLKDPVLTIDIDALSNSLDVDDHPLNRRIRAALKGAVDLSGFKPSDMAIHPLTGQIYIVSSVRKVILVLDPDGSVDGIWPLNEQLLLQPEGLAFLPNGDLFISSEANEGNPSLLRFNQPNPGSDTQH